MYDHMSAHKCFASALLLARDFSKTMLMGLRMRVVTLTCHVLSGKMFCDIIKAALFRLVGKLFHPSLLS